MDEKTESAPVSFFHGQGWRRQDIDMDEILERHARKAVIAPWVAQELNTPENLRHLYATRQTGAAV